MTGRITEYLGQGLAAARPATPDVATGGLAIYFATDTETYSFYDANDAAWQDIPLTAATRASLGLDTTDSPQFAALNIGHASDTTVTRVSAGVIAVAGKTIPSLTDGGTFAADISVPDEAYDATNWNGSLEVPTKNAVRDKIESLSGGFTAASTTEVLTGTDTSKGVTSDALAALWEQGSDVASSGTISLGEGGYFFITGTTTITDIDFATDKAGREAWVKFAGALTLTHNASTLILPGGANITTAAGDTACFKSEGSDVVRCVSYNKASGLAVVLPSFRGALVKKAADQTTANYTAGAAVAWDAETYDTDSIHDNSTNNSRLTVPSGVTKVRLNATVVIDLVTTGLYTTLIIRKNGSNAYDGAGSCINLADNFNVGRLNVTTAVLSVSSGDYFEAYVLIQTDTSVTIVAAQSSFSMEIIA